MKKYLAILTCILSLSIGCQSNKDYTENVEVILNNDTLKIVGKSKNGLILHLENGKKVKITEAIFYSEAIDSMFTR